MWYLEAKLLLLKSSARDENLKSWLRRASSGHQSAEASVAPVCFTSETGQSNAAACRIASDPSQTQGLVPPSGPHAVVGAVCWFCSAPVSASKGKTTTLYGYAKFVAVFPV